VALKKEDRKFSNVDCQSFFQDIAKHSPKLEHGLKHVIGRFSPNKAPGSNGLTGDIYRHFWVDLRNLILKAFTKIFEMCPSTNNDTWGYRLISKTWERSQNFREQKTHYTLQTGISDLIADTVRCS